jgi:8-amino-7-oxononanoate synthase
MHGDVCPLTQMIELVEQYNAYLILDEAHSAGVFGEQGRGLAHALGVQAKCFIRLVTFGKAFGAHGAVVLSSNDVREFLVNFARSFIYTTALPVAAYDRMLKSVEMQSADLLRLMLQEKIGYFRNKMKDFALTSAPNSPVQFIQFDTLEQLRSTEKRLKEAGLFTKAIYAPTVPEGNEGLRVSLHVFNTEKEIDALVRVMSS